MSNRVLAVAGAMGFVILTSVSGSHSGPAEASDRHLAPVIPGMSIDNNFLADSHGWAAAEIALVEKKFEHPLSAAAVPVIPESQAATAAKVGVTLYTFKPESLLDKHGQFSYDDKVIARTPFASILKDTQLFAHQYGVNIRLDACQEKPALAYNLHCISKEEQKTMNAKDDVLQIGYTLENWPSEFPHEVGLRTIILASGSVPAKRVSNTVAAYSDENGTIVANIHEELGSDTFGHEISHQIEGATKAPAQVLSYPTFDNLNEHSQYAGVAPAPQSFINSQIPSQDAVESASTYFALNNATWRALKNRSSSAWTKAQRAMAGLLTHSDMVSDYAESNSPEDFAEIGSNVVRGRSAEVLDPRSPIIREKTLLFLARLNLVSPKMVNYLAARSQRDIEIQNIGINQNYGQEVQLSAKLDLDNDQRTVARIMEMTSPKVLWRKIFNSSAPATSLISYH